MRIQGADGKDGEDGKDGSDGEDGKNGDNFTGHAYIIDLEGDMSTISIRPIDRTRQYDDDYCECIVHAYYGTDSVDITPEEISVILPDTYESHTINLLVDPSPLHDTYFNTLINNIIIFNKQTTNTDKKIKIIIFINSFNIKFECVIGYNNLTNNNDYKFSFIDNIFNAGSNTTYNNGIYDIIKILLQQSPNATMDMVIYLADYYSSTQQNAPTPPEIEKGDF